MNDLLPVPSEDEPLPFTEPSFEALQRTYTQIRGPRKRKTSKRDHIAGQYEDAFELIGGVPRLALWAHEDPGEFYKQYARLIPTESKNHHDGRIELVSFVRPTAIDGISDPHDDTDQT